MRLRLGFLAAHVAVSIVLIFSLVEPRALWVMVFGPGLAISATRLAIFLTEAARRRST
ncbi:hypothetical protein [Micromonospora haikouensis]|nr:hypothetical protein [Micromonospora haikouensis]MDI5939439.1 hypothetical protein [Micromonospora sp. DH15]